MKKFFRKGFFDLIHALRTFAQFALLWLRARKKTKEGISRLSYQKRDKHLWLFELLEMLQFCEIPFNFVDFRGTKSLHEKLINVAASLAKWNTRHTIPRYSCSLSQVSKFQDIQTDPTLQCYFETFGSFYAL